MPDLHRIIYCSRSRLQGTRASVDAEVRRILAQSRSNNAAASIGGALLFSDDCFAQVLEGARDALERAFERIQRDQRHGDVVVLQSHPADERHFPYWSMAYAGLPNVESRRRIARIGFETAFSGQTTAAGHTVLDLLRNLVSELAEA
jgi:hypothetical protein